MKLRGEGEMVTDAPEVRSDRAQWSDGLSAGRLLARELSGVDGEVEKPQRRGVRERQRVSVAGREKTKWDPRDPDHSRILSQKRRGKLEALI